MKIYMKSDIGGKHNLNNLGKYKTGEYKKWRRSCDGLNSNPKKA
jgi:hypothetical protein